MNMMFLIVVNAAVLVAMVFANRARDAEVEQIRLSYERDWVHSQNISQRWHVLQIGHPYENGALRIQASGFSEQGIVSKVTELRFENGNFVLSEVAEKGRK